MPQEKLRRRFGLWVVGGLLALCGALCVAELAAALPQTGGEYVYLRAAYGPLPAFLSGWTSFCLGFSAPLAVAGHVSAVRLPYGLRNSVQDWEPVFRPGPAAVRSVAPGGLEE